MLQSVGIHCGSGWWGAQAVEAVEESGFDAYWTGEHILYHRPIHEAVSMLAAAAALTSRITIGSAVMLLPLRQPAVTAKELASVDVISGGRLVVGVGAGGEFPPEFDACGVPLANRGARLEESIALLRAYWSGETVNFRGRYFDASDVRLDLLPSQSGGPPIWVGGRSLHAQRRAGRIGDGYLPYLFTPSQCREARHVVEEAAIAAGRDVAEAFPFALQQYVSLGEPAAARAAAVADLTWRYNQRFDDLVDRYCICGPSEKILQELGHYVDAGVTHLLLTPIAPGGNESAAVEEIASVLLPELRRVC